MIATKTKKDMPLLCAADFKLLVTIGTGTFGRVYLSQNQKNSTLYALKVLKKADIVRLKQVEHVKAEKEILWTSASHPFIVSLYSAFQDSKSIYMVLEYVCGGELFFHLRNAGRFDNSTARFYVVEITLAIEHLHSQNIVFRDLKPENLLLDPQGHMKITDFGFAKRILDRTWTLCGTPEYLAPEIIQSKGHDKAVDWWALGILMFEMLAGYPPFYDDNQFGIYEKILNGKIKHPPYIDPCAKDLVEKLLTEDRTKRLGNLTRGSKDIAAHKWFTGIDWEKALHRGLKPPIIPLITHPTDTQNFEGPSEDLDDVLTPAVGEDPFSNLFEDF